MSEKFPVEALEPTLRRALADLDELKAEYALVGGVAVGLRTEIRFTKDIDFAVAVRDGEGAEAVVFGLRERGYETLVVMDNKETGRLATVRLRPPHHVPGRVVDLLFTTSGIESEVVKDAPMEAFLERRIPVARLEHLLAMKLLSQNADMRATDRTDILNLIDRAEPTQLDEARRLAQLIIDRGRHRDRDLLGDLEHFIEVAKERRESGEFF